MKIYDKNDELLALLLDFNKIEDSKYFATENSQELQVASFKLNKDEEILRHIHPPQDRNIKTTSEVIIVLEGEIEFSIYDEELEFCESGVAKKGNLLALFKGGHGLKVLNDTKFLEVKQGPYDEEIDKTRF